MVRTPSLVVKIAHERDNGSIVELHDRFISHSFETILPIQQNDTNILSLREW